MVMEFIEGKPLSAIAKEMVEAQGKAEAEEGEDSGGGAGDAGQESFLR